MEREIGLSIGSLYINYLFTEIACCRACPTGLWRRTCRIPAHPKSADCIEMHHTLITTANVRGTLATGRHGLSGHRHTTWARRSTQKHANKTAPRLSPSAYVCTFVYVFVFRGELVSDCVSPYITQRFFLISQIGLEFCLGHRKQREGWWCALWCSCPSHISTHTLTLFLKRWL